jgi:hypothetical protein
MMFGVAMKMRKMDGMILMLSPNVSVQKDLNPKSVHWSPSHTFLSCSICQGIRCAGGCLSSGSLQTNVI